MKRCLVVVCWLAAVSSSMAAFQVALDRRAIEEAILIGQSRFDAERARFHAAYRIPVSRSPVDWIDVVTPFHRVAMAAEGQARVGNRVFGQREALATLKEAPDLLELLIELTFHPMNTFVGVPAYDVTLAAAQGARIKARHINRYPRFGPRSAAGSPALVNPNAAPILGSGQPMLGGTMIVQFGTADLEPNGRYEIVFADAGRELLRAAVDLGKMR